MLHKATHLSVCDGVSIGVIGQLDTSGNILLTEITFAFSMSTASWSLWIIWRVSGMHTIDMS